MKTQLKLSWFCLMVVVTLSVLPAAHAYYDPAAQRWLNRDPVNELGFNLIVTEQRMFLLDDDNNLYGFVHNHPTARIDPWGLAETNPPTPPVIIWNPQFPCHHASLDKDKGVLNNSGNAPPVRPPPPSKPCTNQGEKRNMSPWVDSGRKCPDGRPIKCYSYEECQEVTTVGLGGTGRQLEWVTRNRCTRCN